MTSKNPATRARVANWVLYINAWTALDVQSLTETLAR